MCKKRISIGITAFNEGRYLLEAWNSVLSQTSRDWQAVLVLDGSSDRRTKRIFESINHPKLKKFSFSSNQGAYKCRTKAIELSDFEWYIHLDADDLLPKNAVGIIRKIILNNNNIEFIAGASKHFSQNNENIIYPSTNIDLLTKSPLFCGTAPILRKLFFKMGGYFIPDYFLQCDWDFWLSVYEKNIPGFITNEILYERRDRQDSISWKKMSELEQGLRLIIQRHQSFFYNKDRKKSAHIHLYNNLARQYRTLGDRHKAAIFANKAIKFGDNELKYFSILEEKSMTLLRFKIRRLGRMVNKIFGDNL